MVNATETAAQVSNSTAAPLPALPDTDLGAVWQTAGTLVLVVALMLVVLYLLKRFGPAALTRGKVGSAPYLAGQLVLGPKQRIAVVEVEGRRFMLGVTESQITNLAELNQNSEGAVAEGSDESGEVQEEFEGEVLQSRAETTELQEVLLEESRRRKEAQEEAFTRALEKERYKE